MLRLALPVMLMLLGVAGGVGAGLLGGTPAADGPEAHPPAAGADRAEAEAPDGASGGTEFVRLNNQFVVPIVRDGSVRSLVVMSLTLEVASGNNEAVFDREPRLRDSFLQVLFAHANAGGFDGSFTDATAMDPLRDALGDAARGVLGPVARDVLIVDITRQDA
jgi:hypothetical protein